MNRTTLAALALATFATAAFAHSGVKNAAVKARMDGMSAIAANMKILGTMAKGTSPFDQDDAQAAARAIARHAAATPALFQAPEDDPKSEAKAAIWQEFDTFTALAQDLENAARKAAKTIQAPKDIGPAMQTLAKTCKACHADYRE